MSTLDNLKYNGISQQDHAQIMIHLLHLISATVVYEKKDGSGDATGEPKLNYDNVGFLYNVEEKTDCIPKDKWWSGRSTCR